MILADVNVLIHAFRPDASEHARCRAWLDKVINGEARFGVSTLALSALVRIVTTRKIFDPPTEISGALGFCGDLLGQPHAVRVEPGDRHWGIFASLCSGGIKGPRVTDAWFAALAIEHGCEWITLDRDFARFTGLRWRGPR